MLGVWCYSATVLSESGRGRSTTKGRDLSDRRLPLVPLPALREQLFRYSLDDPRVPMLLVGDSLLKGINTRKDYTNFEFRVRFTKA